MAEFFHSIAKVAFTVTLLWYVYTVTPCGDYGGYYIGVSGAASTSIRYHDMFVKYRPTVSFHGHRLGCSMRV